MKAMPIGGEEVQRHPFLTSAVDGGERSASRPSRCTMGITPPPNTHSVGGWAGPGSGLEVLEKKEPLTSTRNRIQDRPARDLRLLE